MCTSCGKLTIKYAIFDCPQCGNEVIVRCHECRKTHTKYRCSKCNFEGP
ncbi:MAG: zinc finger domain-containing protein [Candidatus Marsarchaeota archaeon]|nr:zinc finger domain-containing protein [Candidatus Marsarchaeota archaeon]